MWDPQVSASNNKKWAWWKWKWPQPVVEFPKVSPQKRHLGHLFHNLDSQMASLEVMIPRSGAGLGISIFMVRQMWKTLFNHWYSFMRLSYILLFSYLVLTMVFLKLGSWICYIKIVWSAWLKSRPWAHPKLTISESSEVGPTSVHFKWAFQVILMQ